MTPLTHMPPMRALFAGTTVTLLALRLYAASVVGYGDSEALYVSYTLFPQASYLDHTGLIGLFLGLLKEADDHAPLPARAHALSSILATVVPWLGHWGARALGANARRAAVFGIALAVSPILSIGLFAVTPDLLLIFCWLGALIAGGLAVRKNMHAPSMFAAGVLAGLSGSAKVSGLVLALALAVYLFKVRNNAPAAAKAGAIGLAAGLIPFVPIVLRESALGFPMLAHRLHQAGDGNALTRVPALTLKFVGGQLGYVSPGYLVLLILAALTLWRGTRPEAQFLKLAFALPALALGALSLFSIRAEPHWFAPALLAPALYLTTDDVLFERKKLIQFGTALAALSTLLVYGWVLWPGAMKYVPVPESNANLARELYGWPDVIRSVENHTKEQEDAVVIAPHWTLCAQLRAGLPKSVRVACLTPEGDDFQTWTPAKAWKSARHLIVVTDDRYQEPKRDPARAETTRERVQVFRGGKRIRVFTITIQSRVTGA
jgi:4-amino-4-deoxy-L-arabinose transferase-like glycosyltransferase